MPYALCRHIRTNGRRCQSPSLTENVWCFYHQHLHQSHRAFRPTEASRGYLLPGQHIVLNPLEDREAVQLALSVVINALASGQLDTKRATALIYGLQVASANAGSLDSRPGSDAVRSSELSPEGQDLAEPALHDPAAFEDEEDEEDDV